MRVALDTNVLVYASGLGDERRCLAARDVLTRCLGHELVLPVQVLGEFMHLARTKYRHAADRIRSDTEALRASALVVGLDASGFEAAMALSDTHGLQVFDAMVVATAAEHGCDLLLSEDMQDGFTWRGTTVADPFAPEPTPKLAAWLGGR